MAHSTSTQLNSCRLHRFYSSGRLANELQSRLQVTFIQYRDQLLAQHQFKEWTRTHNVLAVDQQRTVTGRGDQSQRVLTYTPYGYCTPYPRMLGFNGERADPITGCYLLGNGYRIFNPILMRFKSPDSMSPFGRGGLNAYGYCLQDPINLQDPTGHAPLGRFFSRWYERVARTIGWHKVSKGNGTLFEAIQHETQTLEAPVRGFLNRPMSVPEGYDFVGYHGSGTAYKKSLEARVVLQRGGVNAFGPGFYFSQAYDVAKAYADSSARKGKGHVYGVFVKDFKGLRASEEIVDIGHGAESIREGYVVQESAFDRLMVRSEIGHYLVRRDSYRKPDVIRY